MSSYGDPSGHSSTPRVREIHYGHSADLAEVLDQLGGSILVSTYDAGKIATLGCVDGRTQLSFCNYDRPMGIAIDGSGRRFAVATANAIWFAYNRPDIAARLSPSATSCFLTRSCHLTGNIQAHQIAWGNAGLYVVNTAFSCLCTVDGETSFTPVWRPAFITELAAEDRCHLNGLAMLDGRPKFVTALAESNSPEGWRVNKARTGCLIDVDLNHVIAHGLAMPHSPVVRGDVVFFLNSGLGALNVLDRHSGEVNELARFPGYTRGLAIHGRWAIVGLSKIRESSTFGGLPISERSDQLKCGIAMVELTTGKLVGQFEFKSGVNEIFDVVVVPRRGRLAIRGPHSREDGHDDIWLVDCHE